MQVTKLYNPFWKYSHPINNNYEFEKKIDNKGGEKDGI
jgi:hypothetical protein